MRLSPLSRFVVTLALALLALDASLYLAPPVRADHNGIDIYTTYGGCAQPDSAVMRNELGGCHDAQTGVVWAVSGRLQADSWFTWGGASTYCANLLQGGYADWRLPTRAELFSVSGPAAADPKWSWLHLRQASTIRRWAVEPSHRSKKAHWWVVLDPGIEGGTGNESWNDALCVRTAAP